MLLAPMHPPTSHYPPSEAGRTASQTAMSSVNSQSSPYPSTVSHSNLSCIMASNVTGNRRPTMKPKLTLQTTSLPRTFGSSSTGLSLSLAAGPTASPTVRNTFKNAYEVAVPPSATASPSRLSNHRFSKPSSPYTTNNPYQLPLGVKSILRNSPLEPTCRRRGSLAANGPNGGPGSRRVFFPAKKQVSYRQPLEEEIQTVRYIARHSDLTNQPNPEPHEARPEDESDSSTSAEPSDASMSDDDAEPNSHNAPHHSFGWKKRKHLSAEKQIRAVALLDGIEKDGTSTPQTPCQGRVKRRCEWRWTLGPLEIRNGNVQPSQSEDKTTPNPEMAPSISPASNTGTISPDNEDDSPRSWVSSATSLSSISEQSSSPSSSVALEIVATNDNCKSNTTHEAERAHANPVP
ncbi:hypothetical protein BDV28DRAFT_128150 [Aspergillus coremiiformis]|uniref:Uncharacterized protein n=1 Tax=Aspergillus coremiiformis TaxID=138285 RepID=A0A5N6ZFX0_9EURO|nr:hypothetical protein BDV28DRAFT_128150 [Aspergillus coremiiformis]